jgi:Sap, sulfolipid-1-addressing protein
MAGAMASRSLMSDLLPQLIFLAVGGSIAPPLLLLTILLLGSQRSLPNVIALLLGYFGVCAAFGIAGLTLFGSATGMGSTASTIGRVISATVGILLIALGLRSLFCAPDPEASLPRWIESVRFMSPAKAFGIGMVLFPIQIKNLAIFIACLELIATASFSLQGSILAVALVLVIFAIPVLVLIGLYAAVPHRASNVLGSLRVWMEKNNRIITVVLCFVFGAFFLARGIRVL